MTRQRDIDRTLEAWFLDGPSVMPDRLFDAVFDQVERTPQRRLAHLHLRLTEMNPRIRLFTVLAAALVAVIAAVALIGGASQNPVKASPSPSAGTSASPVDVPPELHATWMGGPRPIPGFDTDAGVALVLTDDSLSIRQSAGGANTRLQATIELAGPSRFRVTTGTNIRDCTEGTTGTYSWSLSPSGQTLEIVAEEDACATRLAVVPGSYWKMDCPTAEDNCLGPADPGTYGSQFLDPFLPPGGEWTPRYGALNYTLPAGWQNIDDFPGFFKLGPEGAREGTFISVVTDIVAVSETDQCTDGLHPGVGTSAEELANWIATSPGLITTAPTAVTVGGLEGFQVDIRLDPAWTETCPWSDGKPVREILTDRPTAEGFGMAIAGDVRMRLQFLDVGDGRAILVDTEAPTGTDFDAFVDDATTILDSFQFTR